VLINGTQCPRISVRQIDTAIESTFGQPTLLIGMIEKRTDAIRSGVSEVAHLVRGKANTREVTNEIGLMLVVTPERVEMPETAQWPSSYLDPK
jgi:hypothetical protein